jgi:hypothetical protein
MKNFKIKALLVLLTVITTPSRAMESHEEEKPPRTTQTQGEVILSLTEQPNSIEEEKPPRTTQTQGEVTLSLTEQPNSIEEEKRVPESQEIFNMRPECEELIKDGQKRAQKAEQATNPNDRGSLFVQASKDFQQASHWAGSDIKLLVSLLVKAGELRLAAANSFTAPEKRYVQLGETTRLYSMAAENALGFSKKIDPIDALRLESMAVHAQKLTESYFQENAQAIAEAYKVIGPIIGSHQIQSKATESVLRKLLKKAKKDNSAQAWENFHEGSRIVQSLPITIESKKQDFANDIENIDRNSDQDRELEANAEAFAAGLAKDYAKMGSTAREFATHASEPTLQTFNSRLSAFNHDASGKIYQKLTTITKNPDVKKNYLKQAQEQFEKTFSMLDDIKKTDPNEPNIIDNMHKALTAHAEASSNSDKKIKLLAQAEKFKGNPDLAQEIREKMERKTKMNADLDQTKNQSIIKKKRIN